MPSKIIHGRDLSPVVSVQELNSFIKKNEFFFEKDEKVIKGFSLFYTLCHYEILDKIKKRDILLEALQPGQPIPQGRPVQPGQPVQQGQPGQQVQPEKKENVIIKKVKQLVRKIFGRFFRLFKGVGRNFYESFRAVMSNVFLHGNMMKIMVPVGLFIRFIVIPEFSDVLLGTSAGGGMFGLGVGVGGTQGESESLGNFVNSKSEAFKFAPAIYFGGPTIGAYILIIFFAVIFNMIKGSTIRTLKSFENAANGIIKHLKVRCNNLTTLNPKINKYYKMALDGKCAEIKNDHKAMLQCALKKYVEVLAQRLIIPVAICYKGYLEEKFPGETEYVKTITELFNFRTSDKTIGTKGGMGGSKVDFKVVHGAQEFWRNFEMLMDAVVIERNLRSNVIIYLDSEFQKTKSKSKNKKIP